MKAIGIAVDAELVFGVIVVLIVCAFLYVVGTWEMKHGPDAPSEYYFDDPIAKVGDNEEES